MPVVQAKDRQAGEGGEMTWNYRVMKSYPANKEDAWYSIREVYYDNNGKVDGYTEDAIAPDGGSIDELREVLHRMILALDKTVLDENGLEDT